ncbi:YdeI family protein [Streptomyces sp. NPDC000345]|uniref:YdeI/OmpD-associated family protein n=1 Tax=Streptomyces sp. NPDC000345 TaxID=3364537 RepID=UPI0036757059
MVVNDSSEAIHFSDENELENWFERNHRNTDGLWLKIAKKGAGIRSVDAVQALDVALCYGWIPARRQSLDESFFLQKLTPRRARSVWSMVNIRKVEALIEAGRMREPGLSEIRAAQADGRWDAAYEGQARAEIPAELTAALAERPAAAERFERLDRTGRYLLMLPLLKAVGEQNRALQLKKVLHQLETPGH